MQRQQILQQLQQLRWFISVIIRLFFSSHNHDCRSAPLVTLITCMTGDKMRWENPMYPIILVLTVLNGDGRIGIATAVYAGV